MIKYLSNGIEVDGEFISKETLIKNIESVKVKNNDLVVVSICWAESRNFDGCYENIVLPRKLAEEYVEAFTGRRASFGEIAGKHSDICGVVEENEISIDDNAVDFLAKCPSGVDYNHSFRRAFYSELEGEDYGDEDEVNRLFDILRRVTSFKI